MTRKKRTLDRVVQFDQRSRKYDIAPLLTATTPRTYTWGCNANLDQGKQGACVGFGWSHELLAKPKVIKADNASAVALYDRARFLDDTPGENYEGTSVLAGAKAVQEGGHMPEYRWAFNPTDALTAISHHGPAVLGLDWYDGMWDPDKDGFLHVTGNVVGGHCILVRGVNVAKKYIVLHNSWGPDWGGTTYGPGTALLSFEDFVRLMENQGECCIPVRR